jgi:hypothetical protein
LPEPTARPTREGNRLLPTEALLLDLCDPDAAGSVSRHTLRALDAEDSRRAFYELASEQRVRGTVYRSLRDHPEAGALPTSVGQFLSRQLEHLQERGDAQDAELQNLLESMLRARLGPVVMKGPALRWTVYEDPVERWYGDFDILLPANELEAALAVALASGYEIPYPNHVLDGYRRHHFHVMLRRPPMFTLELHWALSPPRSEYRLDPVSFLSDTRTASLGSGYRFRIPRPELLLLHASADGLRHGFWRLQKMADMDRILRAYPDLDWDLLIRDAALSGHESVLWLALSFLKELFPSRVPGGVLQQVAPSGFTRFHIKRLRSPTGFFESSGLSKNRTLPLLRVWLTRGAGSKWSELTTLVAQDLAWIWQAESGPPGGATRRFRQLKKSLRLLADQLQLYLPTSGRRRRE